MPRLVASNYSMLPPTFHASAVTSALVTASGSPRGICYSLPVDLVRRARIRVLGREPSHLLPLPLFHLCPFWWMHPRRQFLRRLPRHQLLRLCCAPPVLVVLAPMPSPDPLASRPSLLPLVMRRSNTTCLLVGLGVPLALALRAPYFDGTASFRVLEGLLSLPTTTSSSSVACISRRLNTVSQNRRSVFHVVICR